MCRHVLPPRSPVATRVYGPCHSRAVYRRPHAAPSTAATVQDVTSRLAISVGLSLAVITVVSCTSPSDGSSGTPTPPNIVPVVDSTCADENGDGGRVDLQRVTLSVGDSVTITVHLSGAIPQTDTAMVGVNVASADGNTFRQLAAKWIDGDTNLFVFDMSTSKQENLNPSGASVAGNILTLAFPISAVSDLGDGWKWGAFTTRSGNDVDACPGPTQGMEMQPFAS